LYCLFTCIIKHSDAKHCLMGTVRHKVPFVLTLLHFTTRYCYHVTVCISVCLSHASIVWKRLQGSSCFCTKAAFCRTYTGTLGVSKIYILPNSGRRKFGHGTSSVTKCDINSDSCWPVIDMAKCYHHRPTIIAC